MRIYFSGIGGVALGPLALIARGMGHEVLGSDSTATRYTEIIENHDIPLTIGQDGTYLRSAHEQNPIDWLVYTSALPEDHPELKIAAELGIRHTKRDELLNELIVQNGLKLVAVAGTHGKTTTTGMLVWLFKQLGKPASYSIGTNLGFGDSGHYEPGSEFFIYEADEFDRNFLHFKPYASIISAVDFDHPDTYRNPDEYKDAFSDFISSSHCSYLWRKDVEYIGPSNQACVHVFGAEVDLSPIKLAGEHNRRNAWLAINCTRDVLELKSLDQAIAAINAFPGTERRFEKLADNLYTDYAHHPAEIRATLQLASELNRHVVAVYQPHQNLRQLQLQDEYKDCFAQAEKIYWLPTYLSREQAVDVLTPQQLIGKLFNSKIASPAEMNNDLKAAINHHREQGSLVVLMSAGDLDEWARQQFDA